jgi:hypothetical protein
MVEATRDSWMMRTMSYWFMVLSVCGQNSDDVCIPQPTEGEPSRRPVQKPGF